MQEWLQRPEVLEVLERLHSKRQIATKANDPILMKSALTQLNLEAVAREKSLAEERATLLEAEVIRLHAEAGTNRLLRDSCAFPDYLEYSGVYFVVCGNATKVGEASSIRRRLQELQEPNPYALIIKAALLMPNSKRPHRRIVERGLHLRLPQIGVPRLVGEWFAGAMTADEIVGAVRLVAPGLTLRHYCA